MKLLMISSDTAVASGRHGAFWNTLRGLHEYWDRIDVICPHVEEPTALEVFGNVHFHPLPKSRVLAPANVLAKGLRVCRQQRPDLIAAHSYGFPRLALGGLWLARRTKLPLAVEVHHVDGFPKWALPLDRLRRYVHLGFLRFAAKRAEAFRVVNRAELVPLLRSLGVPEQRILLRYAIYLDRDTFHPDPAVERENDMIFVGRLVPNKGLPLLLDAYESVRRRRPGATFLIVGRGPLEGWLHEEIDRRGLRGVRHVRWVEELSDVARFYQQSRVVVCASYAEGGPRFTVEAMACATPVVSTPVGLMKEIVDDGVNGLLAESWTGEDIAAKVLALLGDDQLYRRCAEGAAGTAARFDYAETIREYAQGYRDLVERRAA